MDYKKQIVRLGKLRHFVERFEGHDDELEISFEAFMMAFFPLAYNAIQDYASKQYTLGYIAARREVEEGVEGND